MENCSETERWRRIPWREERTEDEVADEQLAWDLSLVHKQVAPVEVENVVASVVVVTVWSVVPAPVVAVFFARARAVAVFVSIGEPTSQHAQAALEIDSAIASEPEVVL